MQVFNGQSLLQLKFDTGLNLAAATVLKILFERPDGTAGFWAVTVIDGTKLVYNVLETDINIAGNWQLQSYVEIAGKKGYGKIVTQNFKQSIN
jgi:hypothetical protein